MEMKVKIEEVHNYFKNKILEKDFIINEISEYTMKIIVDEEYLFTLWIGNFDIPDNMKCYDGYYNYMMINFTEEESILLKSKVTDEIISWRRNILLAAKRKELEKLENELKF